MQNLNPVRVSVALFFPEWGKMPQTYNQLTPGAAVALVEPHLEFPEQVELVDHREGTIRMKGTVAEAIQFVLDEGIYGYQQFKLVGNPQDSLWADICRH
jgi:hypothetical protein